MTRNTYPPRPKYLDRRNRPGTRPHAIHRPNKDGTKHGVPRWLRRYAERYGRGVDALVAMHKKFPVPMLNHWRDKTEAFHRFVREITGRAPA